MNEETVEESNFLKELAKYTILTQNDYRVTLFFLSGAKTQKDIMKETGWKKNNISKVVVRLESYGILERINDTVPHIYKVNRQWKNPQILEQSNF